LDKRTGGPFRITVLHQFHAIEQVDHAAITYLLVHLLKLTQSGLQLGDPLSGTLSQVLFFDHLKYGERGRQRVGDMRCDLCETFPVAVDLLVHESIRESRWATLPKALRTALTI
jgi:hypothetical protein